MDHLKNLSIFWKMQVLKNKPQEKIFKNFKRIEYQDKDKKISIEPSSSFEVDFELTL